MNEMNTNPELLAALLTDPVKVDDPGAWHRRLCRVNDWLAVCGDLPTDKHDPFYAIDQLREWELAGVTDIIDVREEWNDCAFVAKHAPQITYHYLGTHDDGGWQEDSWFEAGLASIAEVRARGGLAVVHCHMGVNRAPSMAYRLLLDAGYDAVEGLDAIRTARPVAAILYSEAAISHHLRTSDASDEVRAQERARVRQWHLDNPVDVGWIIHRIRQSEYSNN